jgi:hypothetical protein
MQRRCRRLAIALATMLVLIGVLGGCAAPPARSVVPPTAEQREAAARAGFELSPVRSAIDLVPADQLTGPNYQIDAEVMHDGRANVYSVVSDFGDFEVRGDEQLAVRLSEIEALAAMRATSKTATFASAAGRALTSPFVATWNLVTNPVDSVLGVPVGAWQAVQRTLQLAGSERGEYEDSGFAALIGFERHKRLLAAKLDVDPYSSNKVLQKQLNRFAWAAYAGSLPSMLVPFIPEESVERPEEDRLTGILREYSPEDLRRLNRIELAVMGIPEALAIEFTRHPWYSPRDATILVAALAGMDLAENRVAFIEVAVTAESESDARMFARTARLMREYSDRASGIRAIVNVSDRLLGYTADQTLVLPVAADYAVWNQTMAALVGLAQQPLPDHQPVAKTALLVAGTLSEMAREQLQARGIETTERAFDRLRSDVADGSVEVESQWDGTER